LYPPLATTQLHTLSLHDALPISHEAQPRAVGAAADSRLAHFEAGAPNRFASVVGHLGVLVQHFLHVPVRLLHLDARRSAGPRGEDRKSTRLNSSHVEISYAVFCL